MSKSGIVVMGGFMAAATVVMKSGVAVMTGGAVTTSLVVKNRV